MARVLWPGAESSTLQCTQRVGRLAQGCCSACPVCARMAATVLARRRPLLPAQSASSGAWRCWRRQTATCGRSCSRWGWAQLGPPGPAALVALGAASPACLDSQSCCKHLAALLPSPAAPLHLARHARTTTLTHAPPANSPPPGAEAQQGEVGRGTRPRYARCGRRQPHAHLVRRRRGGRRRDGRPRHGAPRLVSGPPRGTPPRPCRLPHCRPCCPSPPARGLASMPPALAPSTPTSDTLPLQLEITLRSTKLTLPFPPPTQVCGQVQHGGRPAVHVPAGRRGPGPPRG